MNINNKNDIEIYLLEIAERLWSGHASLMIGSGFSMNAKKSGATAKDFPSWNDLGDCFFQKLYGKVPTKKDKCYLDVLKLANEIEATFGRPALNKMLRDEIPNMEYQPSELHEKLLQLPWVDVFTTNYDTLLERTAEKILEQRYEAVENKEDLVWSTKPRIIKLHGSFPSNRPYIITEEDYRRYPKEYAPFVNTVQQSLLENTLCLIGFSGNDLNFQKWIGWIRDNLGKENSPKIFLIGKLSLSVGQKKLLEDKNIVSIDLSCYSENHYEALSIFVAKINEFVKKDDTSDWGDNDIDSQYQTGNNTNIKLNKIVERWKQMRESYPNWLILPAQKRERLRMDTENRLDGIFDVKKQNTQITIEFLYELNWRQEKCLIPIYNEWVEIYEEVINKYNPFPQNIQVENTITPENNRSIDWNITSKYWIELQLSLLRFYREENFTDKWDLLVEKIDKIKHKLSPELIARYCYERCLYHLFLLDIVPVRKELTNWMTDTSLPYWEAKRAGLIAELGNVEDAEKILDSSLAEIRNRLKLSPVKNDYALVSQEAYILQLSRYVRNSINFMNGKYGKDKTEKYSEKWNELIKYKCDPWGELKSFESVLKAAPQYTKSVEKKYNFGIGSVTNTHRLSKGSTYVMESYAFLRYIEEIGIPFKLPNITFSTDAAKKAIACVSNYSPNWGFVSFIRTGNSKIIENIFNRRSLAFLNQQECDELANNYLEVLIKSASEIAKGNTFRNATFAISLSTVIPEILSRLCVKCSYTVKYKILLFLKGLFLSNELSRSKYSGVNHLTEYLIKSFTQEEQYKLLPELLEFPIIAEDRLSEYPDPFSFVRIDNNFEYVKINESKIAELISFLSEGNSSDEDNSKRTKAITRLVVLWQLNLLTKRQQNSFGNALWSIVNSDGFPAHTNYYYWYLLELPHPNGINLKEIMKNYFNNNSLPSVVNENGVVLGGNHNHPLFHNIIGATNSTTLKYGWDKEAINELLLKTIDCWNNNKQYLEKKYHDGFMGSPADYAKSIFDGIIKIFSDVIEANVDMIDKVNYPQIEILLDELLSYGVPNSEASASFLKIFPDTKETVFENIHKQLYSNDEKYIMDAINAILLLVNTDNDIANFVEDISQNIKSRTTHSLNNFINGIIYILKHDSNLLNEQVLENISIGLSYLIDEVVINGDDSDEIVNNKLLVTQSASNLLIQLKKYYLEQKKCDIPHYIIDWESRCLDVNEFAEIRNIWINT